MATFTDLVRAQKQAGKSAVTSLSGAYNQMNMQRFDPRNALFSKSGLMTALFPSLKGYQATPISRKNIPSNVSPLAQQGVSDSPTVLKSIARDSRTSARNSMALPSIARNMAQIVRIWGGTPAKYFEGAKQKEEQYETKFGTGKKGLPGLGKTAAGGGFNIMSLLGSIGKGVGGIFSGIGSIAGSLVGGAASIVSSIFSGIGSLVGGAFSGIFSVLGGALSRMGFMGVILAGVVGFALYSLSKSLDFSKLGEGIGISLDSIKKALTKLYDDVDEASGGKLSRFVDDTQKLFRSTVNKIAAGMETALNLFRDLGTAVLKDMYGFMYSFFKENQGKVLGMVTIGALAAFAGVGSLKGAAVQAAIAAAMAAYGAMTGEKTLEELEQQKKELTKELELSKKTGAAGSRYGISEITGESVVSPKEYQKRLQEEIDSIEKLTTEKKARTGNTQAVLDRMTAQGIANEFQQNLAKREAGSPTPAGFIAGGDIRNVIGGKEGGLTGYNASFGYGKGKQDPKIESMFGQGVKLTDLTIGQVLQYAKSRGGNQGAVGKYQFMPTTLESLVKNSKGAFTMETKFSPETQDQLYNQLATANAAALKAAGINVTADNLHLAHAVGAEGAIKLIKHSDQSATPADVLGLKGAERTTNPHLVKNTIAEYRNQLAGYYGGNKVYDVNKKMDNYANAPTPDRRVDNRDADNKKPLTMNSVSKSVADFARDQLIALDKLTGGQLMKGSTELADMLRDVTNELYKELMNNPTLVDNSQKVVNNNVNSGGGGSPTTASAYNSETLRDLLNLQTR